MMHADHRHSLDEGEVIGEIEAVGVCQIEPLIAEKLNQPGAESG
jgi:hypothetical protein